jgi:hypothetical protein
VCVCVCVCVCVSEGGGISEVVVGGVSGGGVGYSGVSGGGVGYSGVSGGSRCLNDGAEYHGGER